MPEYFFDRVVMLVERYWPLFLLGARNTVIIAITGTVLGFALGLLVAIARTIELGPKASWPRRLGNGLLRCLLGIYIEVFRGTPMIVQAMVIYYGLVRTLLAQQLGLVIPSMAAAIFIVTINTGAYMAEIIRGGIISVDKGQSEAATSIGLTHWQTMVSVVLPQAIRNIMPSIGNEFIVNIKDSSVLNVISIAELFFQSKSITGSTYLYYETFIITAAIYLTLTLSVTWLLRMIERRMDGPQNFAIHGSQTDSRSLFALKKGGG